MPKLVASAGARSTREDVMSVTKTKQPTYPRLLLLLAFVLPATSCFFDDRSQWLDPTPACRALLACAQSVAPESLDSLSEQYGSDADCWGSEASASVCDAACSSSLDTFQVVNPMLEACWVDGTPDASVLFENIGEDWVWTPTSDCDWNWTEIYTTFTATDGAAFSVFVALDESPSASDSWQLSGTLQGLDFQLETFEVWDDWKDDISGSFAGDFTSAAMEWKATSLVGAADESCPFVGVPE
jgi:hypothetical protein